MAKNTVPITATGQAIAASTGVVNGIIVNSHSSGTVKLVDSPSSASGRIILDTYSFPTGSSVITFPAPLEYYEGVYAVVGGTANFELVHSQNTYQK